MKEKFIHLRVDALPEVVELDADDLNHEIYKTLGCRTYELAGVCKEAVDLTTIKASPGVALTRRPLLICDGEARLKDGRINALATWMHASETVVEESSEGPVLNLPRHTCEWLCGDCLLAVEMTRDGEPDFGGLDAHEVELVMETLAWTDWKPDMAFAVTLHEDVTTEEIGAAMEAFCRHKTCGGGADHE